MYTFYVTAYHGSVIPDEAAFDSVFPHARAIADALAVNREPLQYTTVRERYNEAVCAAADCLYRGEQNANRIVAGESVGNHSVTYKAEKSAADVQADAVRAAKRFLSGTGLMYGGLR